MDRRAEVLSHARELLGTRGFNAFSHRDLAERVGVKSSSIHYYFPTKQDIGLALIADYRQQTALFLEAQADLPVLERLKGFLGVFIETAEGGDRWCLAGMLASDYASLEPLLREALRHFFSLVETWLATQAMVLNPALGPQEAGKRGKAAMGLLEGTLLLARAQEEPDRMKHVFPSLLALLGER